MDTRVTVTSLPDAANGVVDAPLSLGRFGHGLTGDLLPRYYEAVARGMVFSGATAVTGVAPGTAVDTTGSFTLANPSGSGTLLVPTVASAAYISGTIGAGTAWYVANHNKLAAAVTGTAIDVVRARLGTAVNVGNKGRAFTTSTLPATPTLLRPAWSWTALLASTAVGFHTVKDELAGEFVIEPGCALSIESTTAAGSSPLVVFGMTWVEIPE